MADEWSKPVKETDGIWATRVHPEEDFGGFPMAAVESGPQGVTIWQSCESASAPRDVVLRLLAAEASDRLGWVWEVNLWDAEDPLGDMGEAITTDRWRGRWRHDMGALIWHGQSYNDGFTPDECVASLHGKFLLEDALREAGA